jgi:Zn-dependent protease with chaperone function
MSAPLPARRTLDFFAAQARARRNTGVLVLLFVLAWAGTVVLADAGLSIALASDPVALLLPVAAVVTVVVAAGSAFHGARLAAGGGDAVAQMLGGRRIDRETTDPAERRLVNVVEEMAIASGLPVPRLFVLDAEPGMNAFAAGFTPDRSIVAVTRGTLDGLDRDELQGVIAHELSHVLNSDTRLSTRLMAMVGGLTVVALIGRLLLRSAGERSRGLRHTSVGVAAGLALLVAGSIGAFFGRLIRLAVGRQREFLADAAAVQFTRNPDALASALRKIAATGSRVGAPEAAEASHLFFAEGVDGFLSGLLSTHPPIEERIRRITQGAGSPAASPARVPAATPPTASPLPPAIQAAAATVGRPGPEHVERAAAILSTVPAALAGMARQPLGARQLACALLLDPDPGVRERQLLSLDRDPEVAAGVRPAVAAVDGLDPASRIALLDLAVPALDHLSPAQAEALSRDLASLASSRAGAGLLPWATRRVVERRIAPLVGGRRAAPVRLFTLEDVNVECLELLSSIAWAGQSDEASAVSSLRAGLSALGAPTSWRLLPRDRVGPSRLDAVLARLDEAEPRLKGRILAACAACATADGTVVPVEAGLVRVVAASLGCPVPPSTA